MRDREGTDRQTDRDGAGAARRVRARERGATSAPSMTNDVLPVNGILGIRPSPPGPGLLHFRSFAA